MGASVAQGWAKLIENYSREDADGLDRQDGTAHRTRTTFGAFVGVDQTNSAGVAGFVRLGFQYRDLGHMPSQLTLSDGTNTVHSTGTTRWLDFSGLYLRVGVGYDLVR